MSTKTKKVIKVLIALAAVIALIIGGGYGAILMYDRVKAKSYAADLNDAGIFSDGQDSENPHPQTELEKMILAHYDSPLPEGKTSKKTLIIGYDGARAEALKNAEDPSVSGVLTLKEMGGGSYPVFAGGNPESKQDTSTAPGWASLLTGKWANEDGGHTVVDNSVTKPLEPKTVITKLIEADKIMNADFIVSWDGHVLNGGKTYSIEATYTKEKHYDINWQTTADDDSTFEAAKAELQNSRDFVFLIFEYTDHAGHSTVFGNQNKRYREAFMTADEQAKKLIDTVMSRADYEKEDWLIIITSDHGGTGIAHGGQSVQERLIFAVSNKELPW